MRKLVPSLIVLVLIVLYASVVEVQEGTRGIMVRFGKVQRNAENQVEVYQPGLHFKLPFIDQMKILDARIQTLDDTADRFVTVEKKDLLVDSYVKWRISNFGRFYTATGGGDYNQAANLLRRKVNDRLRSEIGSRTIQDIVSGTRGELMADAKKALNTGPDSTSDLGIQVIDVRVKQINLPDEVSASIYQRMRAERDAVAREHRSEGKEKAAFIQADVDRKVTVILAQANKTAQELRGEGDAQAAKLYTDAFSKYPDYFSFIRSMQAYQQAFKNHNNLMVVNPQKGDFFKYMQNPDADMAAAK